MFKIKVRRKEWIRDLDNPKKWYEVEWDVIITPQDRSVTHLPRKWSEI